jgi:hypothetical protein
MVTATPTLPRLLATMLRLPVVASVVSYLDRPARVVPTFPLSLLALARASAARARTTALRDAFVALPKSFMYN